MNELMQQTATEFEIYHQNTDTRPWFTVGDALNVLSALPDNFVDCCITSPPYWNKREYANGGIGLEVTYEDYLQHL
jgi:DNA modification methylase